MNTERSAASASSLRINVTWQRFAIRPLLILTFRLFKWLSSWVKRIEGLLWSQRVLGYLWCLGIFRVLGYLRCLRVAGMLWPEWQRRMGGWDVRIEATLLLPRQTCTLHTVFSQVSDRNLHIRERVGVPMARRADLLEVICGVKEEDHMTLTDLWAVCACDWKANKGLAHWTIGGRLCLFVYEPNNLSDGESITIEKHCAPCLTWNQQLPKQKESAMETPAMTGMWRMKMMAWMAEMWI